MWTAPDLEDDAAGELRACTQKSRISLWESRHGKRFEGHRPWTDAVLLWRATEHGGWLVTFDSGVEELAARGFAGRGVRGLRTRTWVADKHCVGSLLIPLRSTTDSASEQTGRS